MKVKGSHRSLNSHALLPPGVEKIRIASVDRDTDWSLALAGVSAVIHLAGRVHIAKDTARDPLATYREVNTIGTEKLARAAISAGVKRLVYVSTIKVNGEKTVTVPFTAADPPRPEDAYAISKWESEQALHRIGKESGLEIVILRPPLVYGRGVGANFMRLLQLVQRCVPLPFGSISNRRSLVYVKNLADAILMSATHPGATGNTFLVSDGEDISTPELNRRMADAMEVPLKMFRCPSGLLNALASIAGKSAEMDRLLSSLVLDNSKIRSAIGWAPRYTVSQGIGETIEWFLGNNPLASTVSTTPRELVSRINHTSRQ
jgi:nucleoside-diphosphate-sugar epimerase